MKSYSEYFQQNVSAKICYFIQAKCGIISANDFLDASGKGVYFQVSKSKNKGYT